MKMRALLATLSVAALALAMAPGADAGSFPVSIGINFQGGGSGGAPTPIPPGTVAGVVPNADWNNDTASTSGTVGNLVDSLGSNTGASVSWSTPGLWGAGTAQANGNDLLMNGYLDSNGGSGVGNNPHIEVDKIPYSSYEAIVYISTDAPYSGRDGYYTVDAFNNGGTTQHIGNYGYTGTLQQGDNGNYLVFTGLSGPTLTVDSDLYTATFRAPVAGIQIVQEASPVPEPASLALLAIGGGALGFFRRRLGLA